MTEERRQRALEAMHARRSAEMVNEASSQVLTLTLTLTRSASGSEAQLSQPSVDPSQP